MNDELAYRVWYTAASSSEVKSELLSYGRDSTHPGEAERYIYASVNWVIFGSDNGLSPVRRQVTIFCIGGWLLMFRWEQNSVRLE